MSENLEEQVRTSTERSRYQRTLRSLLDHPSEKEGSLTEKLVMLFILLTALMMGVVIYGCVHRLLG